LDKKQELLQTPSLKNRALALLTLMQAQKDQLQIQNEIRDKLSHKLDKVQRDAILREQLKTIKEELGEGEAGGEKDNYREKIEAALMPDDVKKVALDEFKRLEVVGNNS